MMDTSSVVSQKLAGVYGLGHPSSQRMAGERLGTNNLPILLKLYLKVFFHFKHNIDV